jgi:hypothetical protein
MNLREKHGFTYGSYSRVGSGRFQTQFSGSAQVRSEKADSAIAELIAEIGNMRDGKISEEELKNAKAKYNGSFALGMEDPERTASYASNILINGLQKDYYRTFLQKINAVTIADVQRVAQKYFDKNHTRIVIVGNASKIIPNLSRLGYPIKMFDKYANPITEKPKEVNINESKKSDDAVSAASIIFDYLNAIKASSNGNATWEQLDNKAELIYWPILEAWELEIWRAISLSPEKEKEICKNFLTYLIGRKDFYKIMSKDSNRVEIQAFNFYGGLATRQTKFPTNINMINNKDGGIYSKTIIFNHGYSINFRIHSASSKVEASLKFDINAIGLPTSEVYQQTFDLI